ncbi:MAG: hypothetical protein AMXMBFR78_22380 [Rubrivivax sp.]
MSTVVLARKYRPRRFDQMVGQEHVVRALTNALAGNRLHHAYLFTGTRGIGKTTVSRILAKSLNCSGPDGQGGVTATPCGVCTACTEIDADRYIDYIELDAASNRGIGEVQELIERAAYKPGVGRFKVFMIDEAHQLTKDAFNALLKTLEEPPEYLKFVLATTDPEKMLPTVLSRCLQFNLRPIAPEVVREHLAQVLQAEGVAYDEGSLRQLGRAARGSMRDALSLTDQAIAYGSGRLSEAVVRAMLGGVDRGHAAALLQALAARDAPALLQGVDALRLQGLSAASTLEEMATLLQQMAVQQAVPGALDSAEPDHEEALRLAAALPADETQFLYSLLLQGRGELGVMGDEHAALAMVLLRFLAFAPTPDGTQPVPERPARAAAAAPRAPVAGAAATAAVTATATATATAAPAPAPAPAPASSALLAAEPDIPPWLDEAPPPEDEPRPRSAALRVVPAPALAVAAVPAPPASAAASALQAPQLTPLGDRWAALVRRLQEQGRIAALVRELALQAGALSCEEDEHGDTWTLVVERESLRTPALVEKLQAALAAELGRAQQLRLQPGVPGDSLARRDAWERQQRQLEAERRIRDDPAVTELLAQFKTARIVPGSIRPL